MKAQSTDLGFGGLRAAECNTSFDSFAANDSVCDGRASSRRKVLLGASKMDVLIFCGPLWRRQAQQPLLEELGRLCRGIFPLRIQVCLQAEEYAGAIFMRTLNAIPELQQYQAVVRAENLKPLKPNLRTPVPRLP